MSFTRIFSTLQTEIHTVAKHHCTVKWRDSGFPVRDPFARIYYVLKGEGEVFHHGRKFRLIPGFLYLIPGFCPFRYRCDGIMDQYYVHMTVKAFGGIDAPTYFEWSHESPITEPEKIKEIWRNLFLCWEKQNPRNSLVADGLARQLLAEFVPEAPGEFEEEKLRMLNRFVPVMNYVENHISEKVTLHLLASLVSLQPNYFSNLFMECFGVPPMKYLQQMRIQRAQARLLKRDAKLAQIAEETGFCDVFHFSKTFRKTTGMSPSEFLKTAMNR